jgi:hypothetical protein
MKMLMVLGTIEVPPDLSVLLTAPKDATDSENAHDRLGTATRAVECVRGGVTEPEEIGL